MTALETLLVLALLTPSQTPTGTGTIMGCVADVAGGRIPGATLIAKTERVERTTTTDSTGCFVLTGLRPGSYRVVAILTGFQNFRRDSVFVTGGTVTRVDVTLRVGAICDCVVVQPPKTLAEAWERADAAMHIRILSGGSDLLSRSMFHRHDVRVLRSFRRNISVLPIGTSTSVLEMQYGGSPEPYDPGKELVIFPKWLPQEKAFLGLGTTGPACCDNAETVFEVEGGRISSAPDLLKNYIGMKIDTFLQELDTLGRHRK